MHIFVLSQHAQEELVRRNIPQSLLDQVLNNPQQIVPAQGTKKVYQSQLDFGGGHIFLLRAIVDDSYRSGCCYHCLSNK